MENQNIQELLRENLLNRDLSVKTIDRYISSFKNVINGTVNIKLNDLKLNEIPRHEIALNYIKTITKLSTRETTIKGYCSCLKELNIPCELLRDEMNKIINEARNTLVLEKANGEQMKNKVSLDDLIKIREKLKINTKPDPYEFLILYN